MVLTKAQAIEENVCVAF